MASAGREILREEGGVMHRQGGAEMLREGGRETAQPGRESELRQTERCWREMLRQPGREMSRPACGREMLRQAGREMLRQGSALIRPSLCIVHLSSLSRQATVPHLSSASSLPLPTASGDAVVASGNTPVMMVGTNPFWEKNMSR